MVAIKKRMTFNPVSAQYDPAVDVLYLTLGEPVEFEGDGLPGSVELDYSLQDGSPCGVAVIGFKRNGWSKEVSKLTKIASDHLSIDPTIVRKLIAAALD